MDNENRLTELGSRLGEKEAELAKALEKHGTGEADPVEIAAIRAEITNIKDEIAGIHAHQRREAEARDQQRRQNADAGQRAAAAKAVELLSRSRSIVLRRKNLAKQLAEAELEENTLTEEILALVRPLVPAGEYPDLRREILGLSFNDRKELLSRELAASGVLIPGLDQMTAKRLVDQRDLVGWFDLRAERIRQIIAAFLPKPDDEEEVA